MNFETHEKQGKTFVLVPQSIFRELVHNAEMLADIQAFDHAKAEIKEYFPEPVVEALLSGTHPVRVFRRYRGLTQAALARKAGIGRANLAMIETDKKTGSVATLTKLAAALGLSIDDLV